MADIYHDTTAPIGRAVTYSQGPSVTFRSAALNTSAVGAAAASIATFESVRTTAACATRDVSMYNQRTARAIKTILIS